MGKSQLIQMIVIEMMIYLLGIILILKKTVLFLKNILDNCIYVYKKGFTTNVDFGENYVAGVKEEGDGNLLLDGITVNEGTAFRDQYRFKYHPNGNVSIKEYRGSESNKLEKSYNNLKRLKGREASDCKTTFEERN